MLSYRHAFHAGNFADVHKHAVLCVLLAALQKKEKGLVCLDTHGGAGRYDLTSAEAQKNAEYRDGIARVWQRSDAPAALAPYFAAIAALDADAATGAAAPRYYPGSPRLVRTLLRPQDRLIVTDLHPAEAAALRLEFADDERVAVHHLDGYQGLRAFLPPAGGRGLVLIDPAYELRDEGARAAAALIAAWQRWPQGVFALWYPLTHRALADQLARAAVKADMKKSLVAELALRRPTAHCLTGSGMLIVNPPWQSESTLAAVSDWLAGRLAQEIGEQRVAWLLPE